MFSLSPFLLPAPVHAQTTNFNIPNTDANVPNNQHYYAQSVLIETLSAVICQLAGIDVEHPQTPCLGINPVTNKLGFAANNNQTGKIQVGGLLGQASGMIAILYTPTISTSTYIHYLSENFGIVKHAYGATSSGYGFTGLAPLLGYWQASRDIAYFLFVIIFMIIGLGIMLRVKIDPRTVMTIQNQIPRIIIRIILITFSYAIAALMIDVMWVITYIGINELVSISNASANPIPDLAARTIPNLLYTPLGFADKVFNGGLAGLTSDVAAAMGGLVQNIISTSLGITNPNDMKCSVNPLNFDLVGCLNGTVSFVTYLVMLIVVLVALLFTFFRVWFLLLKSYVYVIAYILAGPVWIAIGGFEKWIRSMAVNLATFPSVACIIVLARILLDLYTVTPDPNKNFIPPLVADPNMRNFGVIIAFGFLNFMTAILDMWREVGKVPASKHTAAMGAAFATGMAAPAAFAKTRWSNWTARNPQTGRAQGFLSNIQDRATKAVVTNTAGKIPGIGNWIQKGYEKRENQHATGTWETNEERNRRSAHEPQLMAAGRSKARTARAANPNSTDYQWAIEGRQFSQLKNKKERDEYNHLVNEQLGIGKPNAEVLKREEEAEKEAALKAQQNNQNKTGTGGGAGASATEAKPIITPQPPASSGNTTKNLTVDVHGSIQLVPGALKGNPGKPQDVISAILKEHFTVPGGKEDQALTDKIAEASKQAIENKPWSAANSIAEIPPDQHDEFEKNVNEAIKAVEGHTNQNNP